MTVRLSVKKKNGNVWVSFEPRCSNVFDGAEGRGGLRRGWEDFKEEVVPTELTSTHASTSRRVSRHLTCLESVSSSELFVFGRFWCGRVWVESFSPQMTWNSTMSSGYSSWEEDSEEYFFTARTSFFKKPSGKVTESKVNEITSASNLFVLCG